MTFYCPECGYEMKYFGDSTYFCSRCGVFWRIDEVCDDEGCIVTSIKRREIAYNERLVDTLLFIYRQIRNVTEINVHNRKVYINTERLMDIVRNELRKRVMKLTLDDEVVQSLVRKIVDVIPSVVDDNVLSEIEKRCRKPHYHEDDVRICVASSTLITVSKVAEELINSIVSSIESALRNYIKEVINTLSEYSTARTG